MPEEDGPIILHHKELGESYEVQTERQAEILGESGWTKATKAQREEFLEAQAAEAEGGEA